MTHKAATWNEQDNRLIRTFKLGSFNAIILKLAKVDEIATRLNHHPDFTVFEYNKIRFELWTHDAGGITEKDYALAAELDNLFD